MKKILVILASFAALGGSVWAAAPKNITYKGITLTPAIANVQVSPEQPSTTFKIRIENKQGTAVKLSPSSLDFKSLNETGGVAFIGNNTGSLEHKYGLANWISLPLGELSLKPNSSQEVEITIDNRADLSPGGHYAAILFKNTAGGSGTGNKVNFNQVVATLVFLKKSGGEIYDLQLQSFKPKTAWFNLPASLPLRIANIGNTQTPPRGLITISKSGKIYERGQINTDSSLVLPGSTRLYQTQLFKTGHSWLPGNYKMSVTYRPDDVAEAKTIEYSFFYVNLLNWFLLAMAVAIIAVIYRRYYIRKKQQ